MSLAKVGKKVSYLEAIESDLSEHSVVKAWLKINPDHAMPNRVEHIRRLTSSKSFICRLPGVGKGGSSVIAKRCPMAPGLVEKFVYEDVLPRLPVSQLEYYGSYQEGGEFVWLFMEDALGRRFTFSNVGDRRAAVKWLATFHTSSSRLGKPTNIKEKTPAYYLSRLQSVQNTFRTNIDDRAFSEVEKKTLMDALTKSETIASSYNEIQVLYDRLPHCFTHGDFKKKNIHIRGDQEQNDIFVFDWESVGWGIPGIDMWKLDEGEYRHCVCEHWPQIDSDMILDIKHLGTIFRAIDAFYWEAESLHYKNDIVFKNRVFARLAVTGSRMGNAMQMLKIQ
jgi:hypothetical protein